MSYEIGDYVMKTMTGACKIEDITKLNMDGVNKDKSYYLLVPLGDSQDKIYVPVEKSAVSLRKCMTNEEAWKLIESIPEIETIWVENEKMREQKYKEAVKKNDPSALVSVIKMTYQRNKVRSQQGKKSTAADERYFQMAENLLYSELGIALNKPKNEISQLITQHINGKRSE
ncbi:MAG: CarD family transcriptional regulator [Bariatricus sp.]|nr:CarD family transcriptional regulator [Bariatricus sp.]